MRKVSKKPRSKFQEYLKMELTKDVFSLEEDLELERRLAKKLKVKDGKLRGLDDGLNVLLDATAFDEVNQFDKVNQFDDVNQFNDVRKEENCFHHNGETNGVLDIQKCKGRHDGLSVEDVLNKKHRKRKFSKAFTKRVVEDNHAAKAEVIEMQCVTNDDGHPVDKCQSEASVKYIAPHLRTTFVNESEEHAQIRRRVRGFLNKLSESNVESITGDVAAIFQSVARSLGCQIIGEEVLASCVGGPRGNEQYAAVFAAFVTGMASLVGVDFSAKLMASIAKTFEDEYHKGDNLSLRNLSLLLSYMYIFGVCASDLIYDLLDVLSKRLRELDASSILTLLQCCGMKLRGDDPTSMKDFILTVQNKVNEMKSASPSTQGGEPGINSKRMDFMLETICDIKNNKRRSKEDPSHHARIKKWLQKLRAEDILLRGLSWKKLIDPDKKGQWWLSGGIASTKANVEELASTINKEVQEAQKLVQLAASQRMNTDIRRAIFCIIMSGEDYIDAFEKILRLDLSGKQDREIMRVLVECCLQEKVFNKYYTVLASKFCSHDKNHKFTLQYCIWDHLKELESMELIRSMNLARFISEMLCSFSLSLAVLKTVNLMDPLQLTPRRIIHFRMLFEFIFENADSLVWNIFTRVAAPPELESLRSSIVFFIKQYVFEANSGKALAEKFKIAKKALNNTAGILM
ncbi:hypothetical protein HPP92_025446 [Vanilla planifolia]|uniref:MI domain-containing protein n=1 Tax=Vanilla planifolia TaxID=51239 RepID=A0A835U8Y2_VANPL|nr:hypothetical protein HPP92_025446 [Vanilla planifolia]